MLKKHYSPGIPLILKRPKKIDQKFFFYLEKNIKIERIILI